MGDGDLHDGEPGQGSHRKDVAVKTKIPLRVEIHPPGSLGDEGLETTVLVQDIHPEHPLDDEPVVNDGLPPPVEHIGPGMPVAGDHIVPLVDLGKELGDLPGFILTVPVHDDGHLPSCLIEPGLDGKGATLVGLVMDHPHAIEFLCQVVADLRGSVLAPVVHQEHLPVDPLLIVHPENVLGLRGDGILLIVDQQDGGALHLTFLSPGAIKRC